MEDQDREVSEFGREVDAGETPEIGEGGTLAGRNRDDQGDDPGRGRKRRRPPRGRTHATI